jgi:hypothetical protein
MPARPILTLTRTLSQLTATTITAIPMAVFTPTSDSAGVAAGTEAVSMVVDSTAVAVSMVAADSTVAVDTVAGAARAFRQALSAMRSKAARARRGTAARGWGWIGPPRNDCEGNNPASAAWPGEPGGGGS